MKFLYLLTLSLFSMVSGNSNTVPSCEIGEANMREDHTSPFLNPDSGTVEEGGYEVRLAGVPLVATTEENPDFSNVFQNGKDLELVVVGLDGVQLRGLLLIASGGNNNNKNLLDTRTPGALIPGPNTSEAEGCAAFDVASVAHTESSLKNSLSATFSWPTFGQRFFLDVVIVKNCNVIDGSQYYYTQYTMQSGASPCGLFGFSFFCPITDCGFFGRLLGICPIIGAD